MQRLWIGIVLLGLCSAAPARTQSAAAPPDQRVRVSSGVMAGLKIHNVSPDCSGLRRSDHVSGAVILKASISADGHIEGLELVRSPAALREPVLRAVRQWTYKPYLVNGVAVPVETTITINIDFDVLPE